MTALEICESKSVRRFILVVIMINAVTLGMETSAYLTSRIGTFLTICDKVALAIFTAELLCKFVAYGWGFFKRPWSVFDLIVVGISFIPAAGAFSVLRSLRILRVFLFISFLPKLRLIVQSLVYALPSIGWITLLLLIIFYVFAVIATMIFGPAFPSWFGDLGDSFFTLFQIMTLESWAMGIVRPISETYPYAVLFFVPFVLLSSFVVLNVFIAIIVNGMSEAHAKLKDEVQVEINASIKNLAIIHEAHGLDLKIIQEQFRQLKEAIDGLEKSLKLHEGQK